MYAVDTNITFTFTILQNAAPPANIDLVFVDPEGLTTYHEAGTDYTAVYTPPDVSNNGSYVFTRLFTDNGRWQVILADGTNASSYTILTSYRITIERSSTTYDKSFSLPV